MLQTFIKGRFIGGCNDAPFSGGGTVPNLDNGKIKKLLGEGFKSASPIDYNGAWLKEV